jgi:transposase
VLPELPRIEHRHKLDPCQRGQCGADLVRIGEDVSEQLDVEPARFFVHRHIRPQYTCRPCKTVTAAVVPPAVIDGGMAAVELLAWIAACKYLDHWFFAGSERMGRPAAAFQSLFASAKLNGLDPARWLADILKKLPTCPNSKIDSLLLLRTPLRINRYSNVAALAAYALGFLQKSKNGRGMYYINDAFVCRNDEVMTCRSNRHMQKDVDFKKKIDISLLRVEDINTYQHERHSFKNQYVMKICRLFVEK